MTLQPYAKSQGLDELRALPPALDAIDSSGTLTNAWRRLVGPIVFAAHGHRLSGEAQSLTAAVP